MKIKPIVSVLFLLSFSVYLLCPALMQVSSFSRSGGDCELSLLASTPTQDQQCHRETLPPESHWDMKQVVSELKLLSPDASAGATCCVPTSTCPRTDEDCNEEGDSNTQEHPQVGSCCFIGLELTFPSKSDSDVSHLFRTTFSLTVVLPSPSACFASHETALRPHPFLNLYEYFPVYQISPRAPPHSPLQFSHI